MAGRGKRLDWGLVETAVVQMGMSDQEVADLLCCARTTVQSIRKQLGLGYNAKRKPNNISLERGGDPPEDIEMCLNCKKAKCNGNIDACRTYERREFYM